MGGHKLTILGGDKCLEYIIFLFRPKKIIIFLFKKVLIQFCLVRTFRTVFVTLMDVSGLRVVPNNSCFLWTDRQFKIFWRQVLWLFWWKYGFGSLVFFCFEIGWNPIFTFYGNFDSLNLSQVLFLGFNDWIWSYFSSFTFAKALFLSGWNR